MMERIIMRTRQVLHALVLLALSFSLSAIPVFSQQPSTAGKPVIVEWVYRVKYGYKDEWFELFKKNQISILEKQKQLGYVKDYSVFAPSLHTSEDSRWDYRIIIVRASAEAPPGQSEGELAKQLFPDQETYRREENRRWELTANHWDLPIHVVDVGVAK
jgi:hypothetical protein